MKIQINAGREISVTDGLESYIHRQLNAVERRFGDRLTRVEIYLKDTRGAKGGQDKHCLMEARPRGLDPVAADATAGESYAAVKEAAAKLERVLDARLGRLDNRT